MKTSSIDVNRKFQNEGLKREGGYDGVLFLGVTPNQLYIKFILKKDIPFDSLHDKKAKGTGSGIKWDFKEKDLIKVNNLEEIKQEFEKHFKFLLKAR